MIISPTKMFIKLNSRPRRAMRPSMPVAPAMNGTKVSAVILIVRKLRNIRMNTAMKPMIVARVASAFTMRRSVALTRLTPVRMSPGWRCGTAISFAGTSRCHRPPAG